MSIRIPATPLCDVCGEPTDFTCVVCAYCDKPAHRKTCATYQSRYDSVYGVERWYLCKTCEERLNAD